MRRLNLDYFLLQIWVTIYSAFPYAFSNLYLILYSTFDFWALLAIVQVIALGPRFVYKFVHANYFPIDNDIIREVAMVERKNNKTTSLDPESAYSNRALEKTFNSSSVALQSRSHTPIPQADLHIRNSTMLDTSEGMDSRRTSFAPRAPAITVETQQVEMADMHRPPSLRIQQHPSRDFINQPGRQPRARQATFNSSGEESLASPTSPRSDHQLHPDWHYGNTAASSLSNDPNRYSNNPYFSPQFGSPALTSASSPNPSHQSSSSRRYANSSAADSGLRREGSNASFATAMTDPYSEDENEDFMPGYAR